MITIGSLFSGVGALELGLEWAGLGPVVYQVEVDDYARAVCEKHWPAAIRFRDVKHVGRHNLPYVDVICGGSPCPGFSRGGAQAGLDDPRSALWSDYARIVDEQRPRYACFENVAQIRTLHGGAHFRAVLSDFAACGYDAVWWQASAADLGAPHLRERIWLVAYRRDAMGDDDGARLARRGLQGPERADSSLAREAGRTAAGRAAGRAVRRVDRGLGGPAGRLDTNRWPAGQGAVQHDWEPPRCGLHEPNRRARLTALGNIAVPQCARVAGEVIMGLEQRRKKGQAPWI